MFYFTLNCSPPLSPSACLPALGIVVFPIQNTCPIAEPQNKDRIYVCTALPHLGYVVIIFDSFHSNRFGRCSFIHSYTLGAMELHQQRYCGNTSLYICITYVLYVCAHFLDRRNNNNIFLLLGSHSSECILHTFCRLSIAFQFHPGEERKKKTPLTHSNPKPFIGSIKFVLRCHGMVFHARDNFSKRTRSLMTLPSRLHPTNIGTY